MIHCRSAACPQLSVEELPTGVNYGAEVIGSLITASSPFTIAINGTVPQQEFRVVPDLPCSSLTLVVFVVPDRGCRVELKHRCPQPRLRASSSQCGHDCQLLADSSLLGMCMTFSRAFKVFYPRCYKFAHSTGLIPPTWRVWLSPRKLQLHSQ